MFSRKTLHNNPLLANILGVACIIAAPVIGWLPGPGGIPLLITGLGLLSIHNEWARKLKTYVSHHSSNMKELLFPQKPRIELVWDIVSATLIATGIYSITLNKPGIVYSILSTTLLMTGITTFLINRNRLDRIKSKVKSNFS
jgi:hypothetical protein